MLHPESPSPGGPPPLAEDAAELLVALRQRDAQAFERLMRRYNRLLFRAARGIVVDDAEAQDVVQETWLRAFTGLDAFRGDSSLATWLTRIAINQALAQQRKLGRLVLWEQDAATEDSDMPTPPGNDTDRAASPEQEAARAQLRRQLSEAVDGLPPIYRSVFMLRAVEGLGVEETAAALHVSHDVVKTRFLRARAMLRSALQAEPGELAAGLHGFDGQRCDDMVGNVLARLRAAGVVRDH
jgi:RNA polymerase sigma-70 factor (ECF subfamily)